MVPWVEVAAIFGAIVGPLGLGGALAAWVRVKGADSQGERDYMRKTLEQFSEALREERVAGAENQRAHIECLDRVAELRAEHAETRGELAALRRSHDALFRDHAKCPEEIAELRAAVADLERRNDELREWAAASHQGHTPMPPPPKRPPSSPLMRAVRSASEEEK